MVLWVILVACNNVLEYNDIFIFLHVCLLLCVMYALILNVIVGFISCDVILTHTCFYLRYRCMYAVREDEK